MTENCAMVISPERSFRYMDAKSGALKKTKFLLNCIQVLCSILILYFIIFVLVSKRHTLCCCEAIVEFRRIHVAQ